MGTISELRHTPEAAAAHPCRHCGYHPASRHLFGYCSWDCYDLDEDPDGPDGAA